MSFAALLSLRSSVLSLTLVAGTAFASPVVSQSHVQPRSQPELQPERGAEPGDSAATETRVWSGGVTVAVGTEIGMIFTLDTAEDGSLRGRLSIPSQGLMDAVVSDLEVDDQGVSFVLALASMAPEVQPSMALTFNEDGSLSGTMSQAGMTFPVRMEATDADAIDAEREARRPQTPRAPFPYRTQEVMVPVSTDAGEHTLAGTLTLPAEDAFGEGPFPTVVFITGSGAQDRDETIFEHKPFAVIADHLARHGIASLRCDDRGVFGSTGDPVNPTTYDFVDDARAQVEFLLPRGDVGPIGVVGHSEGGVVGPMLAAENEDVKFVVMLAGTGVPGDEIMVEQTAALLAASGLPAERVAQAKEVHARVLQEFGDGATVEEIKPLLTELIGKQTAVPLTPEVLEQATAQAMAQMEIPWIRAFVQLDPREALRDVKQPVLVLNGGMDLQVLSWQNVPEIEKALAENPDVTVRVFPGLNHMFQKCEVGTVAEYASITTTIESEVLGVITEWVLDRLGE